MVPEHTNVTKPHPSPGLFAHAVLRTTMDHYEEMSQWYIDLLSAEIVHKTANITFLRYDEEHHRIAIFASPDHVPKIEGHRTAEVDHLAFTYPTLTELAHVYTSLKSRERPWKPVWTINHGPTTSIYYRDPDGNKVELQVDNFDTKEEADAFMKGPLFSMNPIGTEIDADEWAEEILAKVLPNGEEGLSNDDIKRIKTRKEIGERYSLPEGLS
ncbi:uncharacterized protein A1O9_07108 [Exophiala aquamarina CBS 119918]|uniref:VOC domain-containing protein n=1 Tax=Exophiala aquamarina CBS 119918 TaxID=1182545 RepID=A0A072PCA2_9EURO|nr:uncharacterized protein A1O9_07108 [Exophiala aquamarina CBS 119918]KEF56918.1 hypothetical protein A1O9_07108 [Exophiala aquamarina CBS 119918]